MARNTFYWIVFTMITGIYSTTAAANNTPTVLGWVEKVAISGTPLTFNAKVDTGADNSSIHASHMQVYPTRRTHLGPVSSP